MPEQDNAMTRERWFATRDEMARGSCPGALSYAEVESAVEAPVIEACMLAAFGPCPPEPFPEWRGDTARSCAVSIRNDEAQHGYAWVYVGDQGQGLDVTELRELQQAAGAAADWLDAQPEPKTTTRKVRLAEAPTQIMGVLAEHLGGCSAKKICLAVQSASGNDFKLLMDLGLVTTREGPAEPGLGVIYVLTAAGIDALVPHTEGARA